MDGPPELGLTARAQAKKVIDGDTLDIEIRIPCRIRILDCWAPEKHTIEGQSAKAALEALMEEEDSLVVQIPTAEALNVKDVFTFGRALGRLWRAGDNISVAEKLILAGHAHKEKP